MIPYLIDLVALSNLSIFFISRIQDDIFQIFAQCRDAHRDLEKKKQMLVNCALSSVTVKVKRFSK